MSCVIDCSAARKVSLGTAWAARQVKVKDARFQPETLRGVIDQVTPRTFFVDGDEVRLMAERTARYFWDRRKRG